MSTPESCKRFAFSAHTHWFWITSGVLLTGLTCAIALISHDFGFDRPLDAQPVRWFVGMELLAGTVFFATVWVASRGYALKTSFLWLAFVGIAMRVLMICSSPILEYDYYRYLWDGAVLAHGMNPFRYAPSEVRDPSALVPGTLRTLAQESGDVLPRVSHSELRTIYPPMAQAAFAAAHLLQPWSLDAWRWVLLLFDIVTALLLVRILRNLALPTYLVIMYWWNPLVVREIFNTGHMDGVTLPFALAALMLAASGRNMCAAAALALAAAGKLWPVLLLPVILSPLWRLPRKLFLSLTIFGFITLLWCAPVWMSGLDSSSGFVAYGLHWQVNGSLFAVLSFCVARVLEMCSWDSVEGYVITRCMAVLVMCGWIGWHCRTAPRVPAEWWERSLLIVSAVFLLSPAGFPWYYLWVIPFLTIRTRMSLVLLNCLLPLYYLVFYYRGRHEGHVFDSLIVWFEYVPVVALLIWERFTAAANRRAPLSPYRSSV